MCNTRYDCTVQCNSSCWSIIFLISVLRLLSMRPMLLGWLEGTPVAPVMTLMCLWCVVLEHTSVERRPLLLSPWRESKGSPAWSPHFLPTWVSCGQRELEKLLILLILLLVSPVAFSHWQHFLHIQVIMIWLTVDYCWKFVVLPNKNCSETSTSLFLLSSRCVWLPDNCCQCGDGIRGTHHLSPWRLVVPGLWQREKLRHKALQHLWPC